MSQEKETHTVVESEANPMLTQLNPESRYRQLGGILGWVIGIWLVAFSLYQLYFSIFPAPRHKNTYRFI